MSPQLHVEVWSDVVCPWCYIGKRRFEHALAELDGTIAVTVEYKPYQLDPRAAPGVATPVAEAYAKKFGSVERAAEIIAHVSAAAADEGIEFRMDRAVRANTRLAHRLLWWALRERGREFQAAMKERLLEAYFTDGRNVGDPDELADIAAAAGLEREAVRRFLDSSEGSDELAADLHEAYDNGITAVPTFVINGRFSIPGAQESATFVRALTRMSEVLAAESLDVSVAAACEGDVCER